MGQKEKLGHQCSPGGDGSLVPGDGAESGKAGADSGGSEKAKLG